MWRVVLFYGHNDHKDAEKGAVQGQCGVMASDHAVEAIPAAVEAL
jgi:hypothetical protein